MPLTFRHSCHTFLRKGLRFRNTPLAQQLSNAGQRNAGIRVHPVSIAAIPYAVLIHGKAVNRRSAKDHRTHEAVSDRQRLVPHGRRPVVEKLVHVFPPLKVSPVLFEVHPLFPPSFFSPHRQTAAACINSAPAHRSANQAR